MVPTIRLAGGTRAERRTGAELRGLLDTHDLCPWAFAPSVLIDESAVPHSHPVPTLNTRRDGDSLLAVYLHEQLHWYAVQEGDTVRALVHGELRRRYPEVPVGHPDGARSSYSTYLHLIICRLEVDATAAVLGTARAEAVAARQGVYRWIYRTVLADAAPLRALLRAEGLRVTPTASGPRRPR